ncbi:MAG: DUF885 domain-containing protein [Sphingomonadales bacterium]|nr:DUF885 domain-containing protein [Sphingomonadales bacterium]
MVQDAQVGLIVRGVHHRIPVALLAAALLAGAAPLPAFADTRPSPAATATEDARLALVFAQDAKREEALDPLSALYRGEAVEGDALRRIFTDALDRDVLASAQRSLAALGRIDRARLTPERQVSYDAFAQAKREEAAFLQPDLRALMAVRPLTHFGGLHVEFPSLMASDGSVPYVTEADYRRALALDRAFPVVLDNAAVRFRQGLASGVVESKLTVGNMIAQIDALLAQPPEQSPFASPVREFPASVPAGARPALRAAYVAAVRDEIQPAYRRLRRFLADEYLPAARDQVGLSAMKGGGGLYRKLAEQSTTLRLDPAEVHRLGLAEVARIQHEMEGVRDELGFSGTLRQFFDHIRSDPRYHPKSRQELSDGFARVAHAVDAQIPRYFAHVPKTPLLIQPYPAYREKFEAGGSYNQGAADGSRPGVFFYNTYDLPSRFLTGMTTLYLHEGAPGHHFQISLAQEDPTLPDFQRFEGNTAFVEGWALYAETLGYEMGFYKDPMQHWGTLDDEMLRAMRLVVDTGIHTMGWSREQAIDYMLANSGMGRTDATAEVERYIAIPGQALAYKIGALTIQRLRHKAEAALGDRFDIRAFHEQILGSGAIPLPVLEAKIDRWIAAQGGH